MAPLSSATPRTNQERWSGSPRVLEASIQAFIDRSRTAGEVVVLISGSVQRDHRRREPQATQTPQAWLALLVDDVCLAFTLKIASITPHVWTPGFAPRPVTPRPFTSRWASYPHRLTSSFS